MNIIKKITEKTKRRKKTDEAKRPGLHRNRLHRKALTTGELLIAEGFQEREKGDHSGSDRYCSLPGFFSMQKKEAITAIKY